MRRKNGFRKPNLHNNQTRLETNKTYKTRITATLLATLIVICFVSSVVSQTGANVTVHFIDVGQGDSIFIDTADRDVLIDGGSATASQKVLDYLDSLNITHIHEDHIDGLVTLLNSTITIDTVLFNNQISTSATYNKFIALAQAHNLTVAQRGQSFILTETATLTLANP